MSLSSKDAGRSPRLGAKKATDIVENVKQFVVGEQHLMPTHIPKNTEMASTIEHTKDAIDATAKQAPLDTHGKTLAKDAARVLEDTNAFLEEKNKVKVTMMFRGRQVAHPELGQAVLDRVAQQLGDVGKIESAGRLEGKSMTMILAPK